MKSISTPYLLQVPSRQGSDTKDAPEAQALSTSSAPKGPGIQKCKDNSPSIILPYVIPTITPFQEFRPETQNL